MVEDHGYSERKACQLDGDQSVFYPVYMKEDEILLKEKIIGIAHEKRRFGYRRIHLLLKRAGMQINHKKTL